MLSFTSKTTTLLSYVALVLAVAAMANGHEAQLQQRGHAQLKRIIRKRAPQFPDDFPIGAAPEPSDEVSSESLASSSVIPSSLSSVVSASLSASSEPVSASSSVEPSSASLSASSEPSASASSSQPVVRPSSSTPAPNAAVTSPPAAAQERSTSTRVGQTKVITASDEETKETSTPSMSGATKEDQNKSNILTILIAVAASIGGVAILWTVFRKWKLGSSKKFDKRLQPINWEKPGDDDDIIPANRRHSGASHRSGTGSARNNNNRLDYGLDHDFTAGPTHLSPVGGYADMSRGSSPSPQFGIPNHQSGYTGARY